MADWFRVKKRLVVLAFAALLILTGSGGSCSEARHEPTTPTVPQIESVSLGMPDVRLVVLTDLRGYLEPCGCTSRPLGGLDRLAARLHELRGDGSPVVFVAAGDLFFDADRHGVDAEQGRTQETWRAETAADVLSSLGLAAATAGPGDLREGAAMLATLAARARFPLVAAGASVTTPEGSPPVVRTHAVVEAGAIRVGIIGVADWSGVGSGGTGPTDLGAALGSAATSARSEGADLVVALVAASRRDGRRIASDVPGIDFVVLGGLGEETARPPSVVGSSVVVNAGRQGQGITVLDIHRGEGDEWIDASTWSRTVERDRLVEEASSLRARVTEWERNPATSAADLATQRERLAALQLHIAAAARAPTTGGRAFDARYLELPFDGPRDPEVQRILDAYAIRVNEHNRDALASVLPPPAAEGQPHFVGTARCGECHDEEASWWRTTLHGHAYQTLVDAHMEYNLSCVGCHVTGYEQPGGSTVSHVGVLQDVGCENCHGPGSQHAESPSAATVQVHRAVTEDTCARCHTPDHSDQFVFDTYRRMMIAPGHGLPSAAATH